jgi:hypothetical protein
MDLYRFPSRREIWPSFYRWLGTNKHSAASKCLGEIAMLLGACFVKMSYFVLDFDGEMPYPLAPPQGWEAVSVFENLAVSNQQSAFRVGFAILDRSAPGFAARSR